MDKSFTDNIWQEYDVGKKLGKMFEERLIGVYIEGENKEGVKFKPTVYSGFLIDYQKEWLWISAGHVIDKIKYILKESEKSKVVFRWLDGCQIEAAEGIPIPFGDTFHSYSLFDEGIDFGIIRIGNFEKLLMVAQEKVKPMGEKGWKDLYKSMPEFLYVIGFPEEWQKEKSNEQFLTGLSIIPIRFVTEQEQNSLPEIIENNFYGKIIPFSIKGEIQNENFAIPKNITGISGGPLLSMESYGKTFKYRLCGIQVGWFKEKRIIRSLMMPEMEKYIKKFVETII